MSVSQYTDPWLFTLDEDKEQTYNLINSKSLDPLMERIGEAHYVLLGEATHGTHEFYTWRTAISKRLIEEKGFNIIAVEGDWPDCYKINRYVKGYDYNDQHAAILLRTFDRWPTWMWANWEMAALISWLKEYNTNLRHDNKVGFYGLDVYSLTESLKAMFEYLRKTDVKNAALAKKAILCFEFFGEAWQSYAKEWKSLPQSCRTPLIELLEAIRKEAPSYNHDPEAALNMEQNAAVTVNAENYYRNMLGFDHLTWNLRDTHMVETLNRLMKFYGANAKVILWEHNSHVGDARFTDMQKAQLINVGQLVREQNGYGDTVIVGFGCYSGTVIAGKSWGSAMHTLNIPEAKKGSIEEILHEESAENKLLIFDRYNKKERFRRAADHRAIGVVYDPGFERYGNYIQTVLNGRYDAFIYIDETTALHPLHLDPDLHKMPETYPFEY